MSLSAAMSEIVIDVSKDGRRQCELRQARSWWALVKDLASKYGIVPAAYIFTRFSASWTLHQVGMETVTDSSKNILAVTVTMVAYAVQCWLMERCWVGDNEFNVAKGLAWSFYCGFLKIILQNADMHRKLTQPLDGVAHEVLGWNGSCLRDLLACDKLLVTVPLNCHVRNSYLQHDKITPVGKVNLVTAHRGGQAARRYTPSLIQIEHNGRYMYVIMEGAVPVGHIETLIDSDQTLMAGKEVRAQRKARECNAFISYLTDFINEDKEVTRQGLKTAAQTLRLVVHDDFEDLPAAIFSALTQEHGQQVRSFDKKVNVSRLLQAVPFGELYVCDQMIERIKEYDEEKDEYTAILKGPCMGKGIQTVTAAKSKFISDCPTAVRKFEDDREKLMRKRPSTLVDV